MKLGRAVILLALALGLSACATYYDDGVSYDDGSYYSPADAGRGDYYYAPEPSYNRYYYDEFDRFFFDSSYYGFGSFGNGWYGSPLYSYGGYCSARYRYCPPFGYYDPFYSPFPRYGLTIYFGDPWYYGYGGYGDGYGYGGGYGYRNPPRHRRHASQTTPPPSGAGETEVRSPIIVSSRPLRRDGERVPRRPRSEPGTIEDGAFDDAVQVTRDEPGMDEVSPAPVRRWRGVSPRASSDAPAGTRPAPQPMRIVAPPVRERSSTRSSEEPAPRTRVRSRSRSGDDDGN